MFWLPLFGTGHDACLGKISNWNGNGDRMLRTTDGACLHFIIIIIISFSGRYWVLHLWQEIECKWDFCEISPQPVVSEALAVTGEAGESGGVMQLRHSVSSINQLERLMCSRHMTQCWHPASVLSVRHKHAPPDSFLLSLRSGAKFLDFSIQNDKNLNLIFQI